MYNRQRQWKLLDQIRRKMYIKFELKRLLLKNLALTKTLPLSKVYLLLYRQSLLPRRSAITQIVNRCTVTGRKYSTLRRFRVSRFVFRAAAYEGLLPGIRRDSW